MSFIVGRSARCYIKIKVLCALALGSLLPALAMGLYAEIPLNELTQRSDVAVIGEVTDISKTAGWGKIHATAIIAVENVLAGDVDHKLRVPVSWTIYPGVCGENDFSRLTGRKIWMLPTTEGVGSPMWQGVMDPAEKSTVEQALLNPVVARSAKPINSKCFSVQLIYRNVTSSTIEVPAVEMQNGCLYVPAGTILSAKISSSGSWEYKAADFKTGKVHYIDSPRILSIAPGARRVVTFNFDEVFTDNFTDYSFQWSVPGIGESNSVRGTRTPENDDWIAEENPLWFNVKILMTYPPTREIIGGLLIGAVALGAYIQSRHKRQIKLL